MSINIKVKEQRNHQSKRGMKEVEPWKKSEVVNKIKNNDQEEVHKLLKLTRIQITSHLLHYMLLLSVIETISSITIRVETLYIMLRIFSSSSIYILNNI